MSRIANRINYAYFFSCMNLPPQRFVGRHKLIQFLFDKECVSKCRQYFAASSTSIGRLLLFRRRGHVCCRISFRNARKMVRCARKWYLCLYCRVKIRIVMSKHDERRLIFICKNNIKIVEFVLKTRFELFFSAAIWSTICNYVPSKFRSLNNI